MVFDTQAWLARYNLGEYADTFLQQQFDSEEALADLTDKELQTVLNISKIGHRRLLVWASHLLSLPEEQAKKEGSKFEQKFDTENWLKAIFLEEYTNNFISNGFDSNVAIATLADEQLCDVLCDVLHIKKIGHREKLMLSIQGDLADPNTVTQWLNMSTITQWLEDIELSCYIPNFRDNGFDNYEAISRLTDEKLQCVLGITLVGHRKKLLWALSGEVVIVGFKVKAWLSKMELSQYVTNFTRNGFDNPEAISTLTDNDLGDLLGIAGLGHRKKILRYSHSPTKAMYEEPTSQISTLKPITVGLKEVKPFESTQYYVQPFKPATKLIRMEGGFLRTKYCTITDSYGDVHRDEAIFASEAERGAILKFQNAERNRETKHNTDENYNKQAHNKKQLDLEAQHNARNPVLEAAKDAALGAAISAFTISAVRNIGEYHRGEKSALAATGSVICDTAVGSAIGGAIGAASQATGVNLGGPLAQLAMFGVEAVTAISKWQAGKISQWECASSIAKSFTVKLVSTATGEAASKGIAYAITLATPLGSIAWILPIIVVIGGYLVGSTIAEATYNTAAHSEYGKKIHGWFAERDHARTLAAAYAFVGAQTGDPDNEVTKAYYRRAKEYHPDKGGTAEDFVKLNFYLEIIRASRERKFVLA